MTRPQLRSCLNMGTKPLSLVTASQIPRLQILNASQWPQMTKRKIADKRFIFIGIKATSNACEMNHDSSQFRRSRDSLPSYSLGPNRTDTQLDCSRRIIFNIHTASHTSLKHKASVQPLTGCHKAPVPPGAERENLSPTGR
jgi:hypothetical protein